MDATRATVGFGLATIFVVIALSPGGTEPGEPVLLAAATVTVLGTLAPKIPLLHLIPKVGAPQVEVRITCDEHSDPLPGSTDGWAVYRIGIKTSAELEHARLNILISVPSRIEPCDWMGQPEKRDTRPMPDTSEELLPGRASKFWFERLPLDPGSTIVHYRAMFDESGDYAIRVKLASKSLYGGGLQRDVRIRVAGVDPAPAAT